MTGKKGSMERYTHNRIFAEAKKFIKQNRNKPFFCYCPWTPPHGKYQIPDDEPALKEFENKPWSDEAKVLAAMIRMIDRHVGEVFGLIKDLGIDDNTVVFFCSDNGGHRAFDNFFDSNGPFRGEKTSLYEGGLRIPLIVRAPGKIKPSTLSDLMCYFPDIMPTLAELAGASRYVPADIDGISIVPTLTGKGDVQKKHKYLYWEYPKYDWGKKQYVPNGPQQAIRMGRFKAVRLTFNGPFELYDLSGDIGETNNIAEAHPDIIAKIEAIANQAHEEAVPQIEPEMPEGKIFR
jgi:arylsulfatase A-like enzyme